MRLVRLSNEYVVNLDELRSATFQPAAVTSVRLYVYVGDDCEPTILEGNEAIAAWRLLRARSCATGSYRGDSATAGNEAIAAWRLLRDLCESPSTLTSGGASRR